MLGGRRLAGFLVLPDEMLDWPVGAAGFEPLHSGIEIRQDSQPGAAGFEPLHLEIRSAELHPA